MVALAPGWVVFTCCLMLGLMSYPSMTQASRLPTAFRRLSSLQNSASKPAQIFRAELVHRDHSDSPLRPPTGTTSAQRMAAAAARSQARAARRLVSGAEVQDITPTSPGSGEYLMTIHLGTPPQIFVMIADTGSDLVWVQCSTCNLTGHACFPSVNPYFDAAASSSYAVVPCNSSQCDPRQFIGASCVDSSRSCKISYGYVDGSGIAGELSTETMALSNSLTGVPSEMPGFLFGCMNNDTGDFGNVDGLAGFGRGPNSLPSQITQSSLNNVFSYCLVPYTAATTLTSSLLFGVTTEQAYGQPLVCTSILTNDETFYWVNMTGISINGTDLGIPSTAFEYNTSTQAGGVIFDSGTTLMVLNLDIFTTVVETLQGLIIYPEVNGTDYGFPLCYNLTGVKHPEFPSMNLQFAGFNGTDVVDFPLTRSNLFVPVTDNADVVIPGVECLALSSTAGNMIIGNIAQANHYIQYDVTNLQLGWTSSADCTLV